MTPTQILEQARDLAARDPSREAVFLLLGHAHNEVMRGTMGAAQLREIEHALGVSPDVAERVSDEVFDVAERA